MASSDWGSAFSDWGTQGGGSSGWGSAFTDWGTSGGGYAGALPAAKGGGGSGFWGSLEHVIQAVTPNAIQHPVGSALRGVGYVGGNLWNETERFATHDFYAGPWAVVKSIQHSGGESVLHHAPWQIVEHDWNKPGTFLNLVRNIGVGYEQKYGGLAPWDFRPGDVGHAVAKDPLGTLLDLTVAGKVFGVAAKGAAAARVAKGGTIPERVARALQDSRSFTVKPYPDAQGVTVALHYRPSTLQGRMLQDFIDEVRQGKLTKAEGGSVMSGGLRANLPFSSARFVNRVRMAEATRRNAEQRRLEDEVRRSYADLPPDQVRGIAEVISELPRHREDPQAPGVSLMDPIQHVIDFRTRQLEALRSERSALVTEGRKVPERLSSQAEKALQVKVADLQALDKAAIYGDNPELRAAVDAIRNRGAAVTEEAIQRGTLRRGQVEERRFQAQKQLFGNTFERGGTKRLPATKNEESATARAATREAMRAARKDLTKAHERLNATMARVERHTTKPIAEIRRAYDARVRRLGHPPMPFERFVRENYEKRKGPEGVIGKALSAHEEAIRAQRDAQAAYLKAREAWREAKRLPYSSREVQKTRTGFQGGVRTATLRRYEEEALQSYAEGGDRHNPLAQYGPTFRRPHVATSEARPSIYTRAKMVMANQALDQSWQRNEGVLWMKAMIAHSPEIFSIDHLRQARWFATEDLFNKFVAPLAGKLDESLGPSGKTASEYYVRLRPGVQIPRSDRQAAEFFGDRLQHDEEELAQEQADYVFKTLPPEAAFQQGEDEAGRVARLNAAGFRRIPSEIADTYRKETLGTTSWRRIVIRNGINRFWRFLLLGIKPAWSVFNMFTNFSIVAFRLNRFGPRAWLNLIREAHGPAEVERLARSLIGMREIGLLKKRDVLRDAMPEFYAGTFGRQLDAQIQKVGIFRTSWNRSIARAVVKATLPTSAEWAPVRLLRGFAAANYRFNYWSENAARDVIAYQEAARLTGRLAKSAEELKQDIASFTPAQMDKFRANVLEIIGDYSNLSARERELIITFSPFYPWFKTITGIVGRWVTRHPERLWVLAVIGAAFRNAQNQDFQLGIPLPAFAENLIPAGRPENGKQYAVTTRGFNPLQTPLDILNTAKAIAGDPNAQPNDIGLSLFGPVVQSAYVFFTGRDPFYGGTYQGPLAGSPAPFRALGSFFALPQYRTVQQFGGIPGVIPPYKSKIYATPGGSTAGVSNGDILAMAQYLGVPIRYANLENLRTSGSPAPVPIAPTGYGTASGGSSSGWGSAFSNWGSP